MDRPRYDRLTWFCLAAAMAVPILYCGAQIVAAPCYPNYSVSVQAASMLGSPVSQCPAIFNAGAFLTGCAAIAASFGLYRRFRDRGVNEALVTLIALSVVITGLMSIKAGVFPLPDPRHSSFGAFTTFMILTVPLLLVALWRDFPARICLFACIALLLMLIPLMSHLVALPGVGYGALQRVFALATFLPVAVAGYRLLR